MWSKMIIDLCNMVISNDSISMDFTFTNMLKVNFIACSFLIFLL